MFRDSRARFGLNYGFVGPRCDLRFFSVRNAGPRVSLASTFEISTRLRTWTGRVSKLSSILLPKNHRNLDENGKFSAVSGELDFIRV